MSTSEASTVTSYWKAMKAKRKEEAKRLQNIWIAALESQGMNLEFMRDTGRGQFLVRNPNKPFHESIIHVLAVPSRERWAVRYRTKFFASQEAFDAMFEGRELPTQCAELGIMIANYNNLAELLTFLNSGELP